jgi:glucose/arabinose dehydrogenase
MKRHGTLGALCLGLACGWLAVGAARADALGLTQIGSFDQPVHVEDAPGKQSNKLLFVVEKPGRIIALRGGLPLPRPFLDITDLVQGPVETEEGLLSVAFHPDYQRNRLFYVYFTDRNGDNSVWEFRRHRKRTAVALRSSGRRVLLIPHPIASNHNGGQLQFDSRGLLYIAPGDGGGTPLAAQDPNSLLGKLLRIDPRSASLRAKEAKRKKRGKKRRRARGPYGIPADNPFAGPAAGRDEVYSLGLRNPFRFSFDRATGALALADVGAGTREEVDFRLRGAARGVNFGWPRFEGTVLLEPAVAAPGAVPPIHEYPSRNEGNCAIIGGFVIRDPRLSSLLGRYVYTDLCGGELRTLVPTQGGAIGDAPLGLPRIVTPTSFGEGRGGAIYVTSLPGPVYRLDP